MKILITGATGLVGKALTRQCREHGWQINYLTTRPGKIRDAEGLTGFAWNPDKGELDPRCFEGVQAIVNLAGASISKPWTRSNKQEIQQSRTASLDTLLKGLANLETSEVEYLVSASAIGIYPSSFTEYYPEDAPENGPGFLAETVRKWEAGVREFESLGITCGMLRIGLVLADRGGVLPVIARPVRWYAGAALGTGQQWQSWIHLEDLAALFRFSIAQRLSGVFNAVAPNPVTNEKLTREVAAVLERPVWMPNVPAWALRLAMGERADLVLGSQRVSCEKVQMEGFSFEYPNLRPALEDLLG